LHLSEDEARKFALDDAMRDKFFFEAFQLPHNTSLKILYFFPILLFFILLVIGFFLKTNWWFYVPALFFLLLWVNFRQRSTFGTPILYWFKSFIEEQKVAEGDLNPSDWRSYFSLPYPQGRADINMMINACYEEVHFFGFRVVIRSLLMPHLFCLSAFSFLAYFAWRH
jgi:hypothetical protein